MLAGLVFVTSLSYMGTSAYNLYTSPNPSPEAMAAAEAANLIAVYDKTASEYDAEVESTEYWYGIMRLRRKMVKQARGDVLESAAGTGRNTEFYIADRVRSLTLVDASKAMLEICREKWVDAHPPHSPSKTPTDPWSNKTVQFLVYNLENSHLSPPTHPTRGPGYDTIIQTMGLCATPSPINLLTSLSSLLRPGGRILLLEHGKSHYDWLNVILTKSAPGHAARYGCWWNRDIGKIVEESGLEVVEIRRPWWFLGTTWWVELKRRETKAIDRSKSSLETKISS
jgi:methyltransferase OMS1